MDIVYKWNDEAKKLFDNQTSQGIFLDDGETWSPEGFIVALDEKDEEHQEVLEGDGKLRNIDSKFLAVNISDISAEDMEYLFNKYGKIYNQ